MSSNDLDATNGMNINTKDSVLNKKRKHLTETKTTKSKKKNDSVDDDDDDTTTIPASTTETTHANTTNAIAPPPPNNRRRIDLPMTDHYHISYLHTSTVTCVTVSHKHSYIITGDTNGIVKFWKRLPVETVISNSSTTTTQQQQHPCLEFVKSFTAHLGSVLTVQVDTMNTNDYCISIGSIDSCIKFYDIATFDVVSMTHIPLVTIDHHQSSSLLHASLSGVATWIGDGGSFHTETTTRTTSTSTSTNITKPYLAVADRDNGSIYIVTPIPEPTLDNTPTNSAEHLDDMDKEILRHMSAKEQQQQQQVTTNDAVSTTNTTKGNDNVTMRVTLHGTTPVSCMAYVPNNPASFRVIMPGL